LGLSPSLLTGFDDYAPESVDRVSADANESTSTPAVHRRFFFRELQEFGGQLTARVLNFTPPLLQSPEEKSGAMDSRRRCDS